RPDPTARPDVVVLSSLPAPRRASAHRSDRSASVPGPAIATRHDCALAIPVPAYAGWPAGWRAPCRPPAIELAATVAAVPAQPAHPPAQRACAIRLPTDDAHSDMRPVVPGPARDGCAIAPCPP